MINEKNPNVISHNNHNTLDKEKNNYIEIEKFVMQYEDKLYFYDALYEYMSNFIKMKKVRYNLTRDKPQNLGVMIENILRDRIKSKKNLDNYKNKLKLLIIK